jgi:hypothetical protein
LDTAVISKAHVITRSTGNSAWAFGNISGTLHGWASNREVTVRIAGIVCLALGGICHTSIINTSSVANWAGCWRSAIVRGESACGIKALSVIHARITITLNTNSWALVVNTISWYELVITIWSARCVASWWVAELCSFNALIGDAILCASDRLHWIRAGFNWHKASTLSVRTDALDNIWALVRIGDVAIIPNGGEILRSTIVGISSVGTLGDEEGGNVNTIP